jgi:hypothetical protein
VFGVEDRKYPLFPSDIYHTASLWEFKGGQLVAYSRGRAPPSVGIVSQLLTSELHMLSETAWAIILFNACFALAPQSSSIRERLKVHKETDCNWVLISQAWDAGPGERELSWGELFIQDTEKRQPERGRHPEGKAARAGIWTQDTRPDM